MYFIIVAIFIYNTVAQITLITTSNSSSNISSTSGCYPIQPYISEVKGAEGYKLEFYIQSNCKGRKVEEITGKSVFKSLIYALSIKVVKTLQNNNQANGLGSEETIKGSNIESFNH
jgi:hypothetical protein